MRVTFSRDAMADGPDAAHVVFDRLKGIQYTVYQDSELVGEGLILTDVGYHDTDSIFLSFTDIDGGFIPEYYIVVAPDSDYGGNLRLEYC